MSKNTTNAFQQSAAQPPPSSAPKRVKVTLACVVCRKKKVKCDGVQPSCSRCNSMGLACEYSDPPRKRGPPKGCIEVIENRAHRIESLLGKDPLVWQPSQRMANTMQRSMTDKVTAPLYAVPVSSVIPDAPVTNVGTQGDRLSHGPNPLLDIVSSAMATHKSLPGSHDRDCNLTFSADESALADSFFAHFNLFFPILSRQHYLHQLQHRLSNLDPLLRNAVLALGSRYAGADGHANPYFERCQEILNASQPHDSVALSTVQAFVVMCWYCYLAGDMHACRSFRHKLVSMIHDLGLYRDPDASFGIVEMELRRRAFWVAFVIDQWLACYLGEALLTGQSWDCRWPQLEDSQLQAIDRKHLTMSAVPVDYALQITAFAEMIKLARIVSEHLSGSSAAPAALTNWLFSLPSYLEFNRPADDAPPAPITRIYHMLYYTAQIMLHRASDTYGVCTSAANTIVHIADQMIQNDQTKYLYNTSLVSLTLATAVHLDRRDNRSNLHKSIYAFRGAHLVLLKHLPLDALLAEFIERYEVTTIEDTSYQQQQEKRSSVKRPREEDEQSYPQQQQQPALVVDDLMGWTDVLSVEKLWLTTGDLIGNASKGQQQQSFVSPSSAWSLSSPGSSTHSPSMSCDQPLSENKDLSVSPFDLLYDNDMYTWMFHQQQDIFIPTDFDLPV